MQVGQHQGDAVHRGLYFATWGGISGRDEEDQRLGKGGKPSRTERFLCSGHLLLFDDLVRPQQKMQQHQPADYQTCSG
jgi:hypothetical protein